MLGPVRRDLEVFKATNKNVTAINKMADASEMHTATHCLEDGSRKHTRSFNKLLLDCTALHLKRQVTF